MLTLKNWNASFRYIYIISLVTLWVGATIANISTIFGQSVDVLGLAGISVFVGVQLVRSYKGEKYAKIFWLVIEYKDRQNAVFFCRNLHHHRSGRYRR